MSVLLVVQDKIPFLKATFLLSKNNVVKDQQCFTHEQFFFLKSKQVVDLFRCGLGPKPYTLNPKPQTLNPNAFLPSGLTRWRKLPAVSPNEVPAILRNRASAPRPETRFLQNREHRLQTTIILRV